MEINRIQFGIHSAVEIQQRSVVEIYSTKMDYACTHGVYDTRMGVIDSALTCATCHQHSMYCPGHFGHINLHMPVINPCFYKTVHLFLRLFCHTCSRLIISDSTITLMDIPRKAERILLEVERQGVCVHCLADHPEVKFVASTATYTCIHKHAPATHLGATDIHRIFNRIQDTDLPFIGFNALHSHPRNMLFTVFPVIPICCRPYVHANGSVCDDDLSVCLVDIIKVNNQLGTLMTTVDPDDDKFTRCYRMLVFKISVYFNNTAGKAKHNTSNRVIKGIRERLVGKEGLIRTNLLGKRCNQSARTVAGSAPLLRTGWVGIPHEVADILTVPIRVNSLNLAEVQRLVDTNRVAYVRRVPVDAEYRLMTPDEQETLRDNHDHVYMYNHRLVRYNMQNAMFHPGTMLEHGDEVYRLDPKGKVQVLVNNGDLSIRSGDMVKRNGTFLTKIIHPHHRPFTVQLGDIADRKLQNGDWVLLNRQPTLHSGGMIAHQIMRLPGKTFRVNLAITKSFNLDNDGDELNIHTCGSLESMVELRELSSVKNMIIGTQSSKPNIVPVQDALLGMYNMSIHDTRLTRAQFAQLVVHMIDPEGSGEPIDLAYVARRAASVRQTVYATTDPAVFTSHMVISVMLHPRIHYRYSNTHIVRGMVMPGSVIDKSVIGSSSHSLIGWMYRNIGVQATLSMVDNIQFVTNAWNLMKGFSVGLGDCMVRHHATYRSQLDQLVHQSMLRADRVSSVTCNPLIREVRVCAALDTAKDNGLRLAKETLVETNNFMATVKSGSKGDFFNIAQITGLLGQQTVNGCRIQPSLTNGKRSLPYYPCGHTDIHSEYESRGFISNSFIMGLNPREFFFHAMSGREGICSTATGTAVSGYMQRKIVKLTEDIKVQVDNTVRDSNGRIYQFRYANTGFDPGYCNPNKTNAWMDSLDQIFHEVNGV